MRGSGSWRQKQSTTHRRLFAALPRLGSDQRRCLHLRYYEGFPADLTACLMGRTPNAVRLLERRALRRLRIVLTAPEA